jgi:hypothetical protein
MNVDLLVLMVDADVRETRELFSRGNIVCTTDEFNETRFDSTSVDRLFNS